METTPSKKERSLDDKMAAEMYVVAVSLFCCSCLETKRPARSLAMYTNLYIKYIIVAVDLQTYR
jgi:hypothetical protein